MERKWKEQPGKEKGKTGDLGSKERVDHTLSPDFIYRCLLLLILEKNVMHELSRPLGRFNLGDLNILCRSP